MPRLETVKVPPSSSAGVSLPGARLLGQLARLPADLRDRLPVGPVDDRNEERVLGCDGDPDVDLG